MLNYSTMLEKIPVKKIFFAIILLGIIVRIFYFVIIPEGSYNDALFHIDVSQQVIQNQSFDISPLNVPFVPPPFYYSLFASFSILNFFEIGFLAIKIFPLIIEVFYLLFAFIVFKKLFKEKYYVPLAFFTIFPWGIRFSGINYVENISLLFVFSTIYFLLTLIEKKEIQFFSLIPLILSISALSLSKLNGTLLVPIFFLSSIYALNKNKVKNVTLILFSISTILLASFWYILNFLKLGVFDQHLKYDFVDFSSVTGFSLESIVSNFHFYYLYFFDFPFQSAFAPGGFLDKFDFFGLAIIFFLMVLPLFFTI